MGPDGPGPYGLGPVGPPWALMGRALMGQGLMGSALIGRALWARPLLASLPSMDYVSGPPLGPCGLSLGMNIEHNASRFSGEPETRNATYNKD